MLSLQDKISPSDPEILDGRGYAYYCVSDSPQKVQHKLEAEALSRDILDPKLRDPNFLVLHERRAIFCQLTQYLPDRRLRILDVGGRLQPYRLLLKERIELYVAVDPILEGLVNVVALAESLPFADESFDLVICTQVLNYSIEPFRMIAEMHRVLKKGSLIFVSVPAIFPRYHDQRWRFMPEGLLGLLSSFCNIEIIPEGFSIAGFLRTINLFLDTFIRSETLRALVANTVFPTTNLAGLLLDGFSHGRTQFTTNYSCMARKRDVPCTEIDSPRYRDSKKD